MPVPAILLETCRGVKPSGCPHAAPLSWDWVAALVNLAATTPQSAAMAALARPLRRHEQFRLAVCACPNGCVRPHVADLGLAAALDVAVDPTACTGCGLCVAGCPDRAMTLRAGKAGIDAGRCQGCGQCATVCPTRAVTTGGVGFRAFLGGRLGRRPHLGHDLGHSLPPADALALAERSIAAYVRHMRPGLRFGDILSPGGLPGLPAWVLS